MATYYIDFQSGSDVSVGTSKLAPWKRCPGMNGFAGSYSQQAGDTFIFKGGVSWTSGCFPMTWKGGIGGLRTIYTTDPNWFSGGSFTRPIFDRGGVATHTLMTAAGFVTFNNIEVTGFSWNAGSGGFGTTMILVGGNGQITISNCYFHGWTHAGFGSGCRDDLQIILGSSSGPAAGTLIDSCTFDGSLSNDSGMAVYCMPVIRNCVVKNMANGILPFAAAGVGEVSGCDVGPIINSFDGSVHSNSVETLSAGTFDIHHNKIHDAVAICIFVGTGSNNVYNIYDNLIWNSSPIPIQFDGRTGTGNVAKVYNNTIVDSGGRNVINNGNGGAAFTVTARNNHIIGGSISPNTSNNLTQTSGDATTAGYTLANLYKPTSVSSPTVDQGFDLTGIVTTDLLGVTRTVPYDIGAYQFAGQTPNQPILSVSPNSLDFGSKIVGDTSAGLSAVISNTGNANANLNINPAAPFQGGGNVMVPAGGNITVTFLFRPAQAGNFSTSITIGGATLSLKGIAYPIESGLMFEADTGVLTAPMTDIGGGHISQSVPSNSPLQGGRASYGVTIPADGDYTVKVNISATDSSTNSVWINFDSEPTDPTMIWDVVQITNGYQDRVASWRGTGDFQTPQFSPKVWTLTAGVHELIIRGREQNVGIGTITIQSNAPVIPEAPAAPSLTAPANAAVNQSLTPVLSWTEADTVSGFSVYFGTTNPPAKVMDLPSTTLSYSPSTLAYSTVYYWKVRAFLNWSSQGQNGQVMSESGVRSFTTLAQPVTRPPTVTMISPGEGTIYTAPATINFTALAVAGTHPVAKVEFYINGSKVGEDTGIAGMYSYSQGSVTAGAKVLLAKALDNQGSPLSANSQSVNVLVMAAGTHAVPTVIYIT